MVTFEKVILPVKRKAAFTLAEVFSPHPAGQQKSAFTLAEVLITLGVIGVVAALTVPQLIQNYQDKAIVTGVKQAYSLINNAFLMAQEKYGPANTWTDVWASNNTGTNVHAIWFDRIAENLKVANNCGTIEKCYGHKNIYKNYFDPSSKAVYLNNTYKTGILSNGMILKASGFRTAVAIDGNQNNISPKWWGMYGAFTVDINGTKGPNTYGKDIFTFLVYDPLENWNTKNTPRLMAQSIVYPTERCLTEPDGQYISGSACTAWVMEYENVDYLHCREKLIQTGKHSCK